jgi:uncharacterized protein YqjF (DUF2071 family)
MANFPVDPGILKPYVPAGTILDDYQGTTYVSMVGFEFLQTKVFGVPIPLHRDFEEINLRFYVRRQYENETRLGVVFIKEIVPRLAIALVARGIYEEPYVSLPTRCKIEAPDKTKEGKFLYEWEFKDRWCHLSANVQGSPKSIEKKSLEEFIIHREWGYNKQSDGTTMEYRVEHPSWNVWNASSVSFECDVEGLYGHFFVSYLSRSPASTFVADGSNVIVYRGIKLE